MSRTRRFLVMMLAMTLIFTLTAPVYAERAFDASDHSQTDSHPGKGKGKGKHELDLVDANASVYTKSLFAYLQGSMGERVLFGQQHVTDEGLTISTTTGTESDVKNAVGDYPAIFGWDTLSLQGYEKPGSQDNTDEENVEALAASMIQAYELGGIVTLSTHPRNFVTGGAYNDTSVRTVEHILPGGAYHDELNAYLDLVADLADSLVDKKGEAIPLIFRPWHEQSGSWFWWGAGTTTSQEYIALYRYTVEYLRDAKGVRNLLYAWSPNASFQGDADKYLTTYPGDDYVDILGMDQYDNKEAPGTDAFLGSVAEDLGMIVKLAEEKGKIAALTEFGFSPQGMYPEGNAELEWFTKLLNAIQSDPDARKIAYMQTWANFGYPNNIFVPYRDSEEYGSHELLPDFVAFYEDAYSAFAGELKHVYSKRKRFVAEEQSFMHIASPIDQSTVRDNTTLVRARLLNMEPDRVVYTVGESDAEVEMTLDRATGYYTAEWSPPGEVNGHSTTLTVRVYDSGEVTHEQTNTIYVQVEEILLHVYTFDEDISGIQNNGTWPDSMGLELSHGEWNGDGVLELSVTDVDPAETWQEWKLELPQLSDEVALSAINRVKFDLAVPAAAGESNDNATLRGVVMLPPDWEEKYGMTSTEVRLADLEAGEDGYLRYAVSIDVNNIEAREAAESLAISIVGNGMELAEGNLYVDNIELYSYYYEPPADPALVDNFEGYMGSDEKLNNAWTVAGDGVEIALDSTHASEGNYALNYTYTLGGQGYAGRITPLDSVDWSGFNKLRFWLVPDGNDQRMVVQIRTEAGHYEAFPSLAGTEGQWVDLHFNDFIPASWDTNQGSVLTKESLQSVTQFAIYVNAVDSAQLTSTLYLDAIKAIYDEQAPTVPNGGSGPGSTPEQEGLLYGFEEGAEGWTVEVNNASASPPISSEEAAAEGTRSLATAFSTEGSDFELTKVQALDLSQVDTLLAQVKLSGGTAKATLYVKTGEGWQWHDGGQTDVGTAFAPLAIDLSGIANPDQVQSIGIKLESFTGSGEATVYVDDVRLVGGSGGEE